MTLSLLADGEVASGPGRSLWGMRVALSLLVEGEVVSGPRSLRGLRIDLGTSTNCLYRSAGDVMVPRVALAL